MDITKKFHPSNDSNDKGIVKYLVQQLETLTKLKREHFTNLSDLCS